jgi:hypothetical protein
VATSGAARWPNTTSTWFNLSTAQALPAYTNKGKVQHNPFNRFSATCLNFGRELSDALQSQQGENTTAVPIGLIQSAVGGTQIEAWMSNETKAKCKNTSATPGLLYYGMVAPFVNMTVKGWIWYQGENNVHGVMGNSAAGYYKGQGYGCEMPKLVELWRQVWSAVPGTTDSMAPFGIVSLAAGGSEGAGYNMAHMRWSQTANYGHLPNPALPHCFMAHAYDLGDPWTEGGACTTNSSASHACNQAEGGCCKCGFAEAQGVCDWDPSQWNDALRPLAPLVHNSSETKFFMG